MSVNPQTTGNLNWHSIADTGNGKGVRLCCCCEVAWVENASVSMAFTWILFLVLVRTTCFAGACISGVTRRDLILISASSGRY